MTDRLARALALIDVANAADPAQEDGRPAALLYGERMSAELDRLFPDDVFDFIKIDVQGSELDILKGGKNLVSRARALLLEVATSDYNPGAPRKEEVVAYCLANGFKQAITVEVIVHPVTRQPIQEDVLFLR